MTEFVLYGGKGGVGKTTCAAATALKLARRGERVLVVSTDPAHSLGDSLEVDLESDPTPIAENLWGAQPSEAAGQAAYKRVVESLAGEFRSAGLSFDAGDVEELFAAGIVPGSDELAALQFFDQYADTGEWDRLVFDTAPTAATLRLLGLPALLEESLATVAKLRGQVRDLAASMRSLVFGPMGALGGTDETGDLEELRAQMERVGAAIRDPARTDFRVVLVPERLAIEETVRLVDELRASRVPVDTLVVNRVLTDFDERCTRCRTRHAAHDARLAEIEAAFPDFAIQVVSERSAEADGRSALDEIASQLRV